MTGDEDDGVVRIAGADPADQDTVAALAGKAQAADEVIARLEGQVDQLSDTVVDLAGTVADVPAGGPWCWRYLDPYETAALLHELRDWVDWATVRYHIGSIIRPCWHQHPAAVEELTAVYVAWRAAYKEKPRGYSSDLIAWHDRWFWPCLHRLQREKVLGGCTPLKHEEEEDRTRVTDPDRFDAHLHQVMHQATPGADAERVHAAIDAGDAIPLRPKDPTTPVKWGGTWWAILANSPDGLWVPRPPRVAAALEELLGKQTSTKDPTRTGRTGEQ